MRNDVWGRISSIFSRERFRIFSILAWQHSSIVLISNYTTICYPSQRVNNSSQNDFNFNMHVVPRKQRFASEFSENIVTVVYFLFLRFFLLLAVSIAGGCFIISWVQFPVSVADPLCSEIILEFSLVDLVKSTTLQCSSAICSHKPVFIHRNQFKFWEEVEVSFPFSRYQILQAASGRSCKSNQCDVKWRSGRSSLRETWEHRQYHSGRTRPPTNAEDDNHRRGRRRGDCFRRWDGWQDTAWLKLLKCACNRYQYQHV